ncbi:MAG: hypothetical protein K0S65_3149 [Labilithrix sp.]|nr:hypothetical protein [Labilithrix sp.]
MYRAEVSRPATTARSLRGHRQGARDGVAMTLASVGPVEGPPSSFGRSVAKACAELGTPKLVIVYLPIQPKADLRAYLAAAAAASHGAAVVGMTTGGAAFTERGVSHDGAVAAVLGGDVRVRVAVARHIDADVGGLHRALRTLHLESARSPSMLVMMDAYAADGEVLISALREHTPVNCRCFGGTAGDDWKFTGTYVFHQGEVCANTAVFVLLESPTKMAMDVLHGWCAIERSRALTITAIDGNILRQLDGQPAAEVYRAELERLGLLERNGELLPAIHRYELGTRTRFGEGLKIRAPLAIANDGAITLASGLPLGESVRIVEATPKQLVTAAETLTSSVTRQIGAPLRGALVFDCAARRNVLGDRYPDEASAFTAARTSPTVGVSSYGEIAKFGGSVEGFHNSTAVMVGW